MTRFVLALLIVTRVSHADTTLVAGGADKTLCAGWSKGCTKMATDHAPAPREDEALVWSGTELIVWGGRSPANADLHDGAVFDPATNRWRSITMKGAPPSMEHPIVVWTGDRMFVWGDAGGALYDPKTDRWQAAATGGPKARAQYGGARAWVVAGKVLLWPPNSSWPLPVLGKGFRFDPATNTWDEIAASPLSKRSFPGVAIGGGKIFVWGGSADGGPTALGDGALYDPTTNTWTQIATKDAPSRRYGIPTEWNGSEFVIHGGTRSAQDYGKDISKQRIDPTDGARYDPKRDVWVSGPGTKRAAGLDVFPQSFDFQYNYRLGPDRDTLYGYGSPGAYRAPDHFAEIPQPAFDDSLGGTRLFPLGRKASALFLGSMQLTNLYWRDDTTGVFTAVPAVGDGKRTFRLIWTGNSVIAWGGKRETARTQYTCPTHCRRGAPCAAPLPCFHVTETIYADGMMIAP